MKDLLLHQAGLYPYIKFYEAMLSPTGGYIDGLVTEVPDKTHHKMITASKYLLDSWSDTIKNKILRSTVTAPGKYIYSDNDFIFLGMIV